MPPHLRSPSLWLACALLTSTAACGPLGENRNLTDLANENQSMDDPADQDPDMDGQAPDGQDMDGADPGDTSFNAFQDPDSDFSTTDVRDVDGEIVRFDAGRGQLIWAEDGSAFNGWPVNGNRLGPTGFFQVRFGSEEEEQRAYFTETLTATICDIVPQNGRVQIFATTTPVPQE